MHAKDLTKLNNKKREQLNKENLSDYEEMLVYIRGNFNKSEQQTEEILMELLDHLLEAQNEGKTAKEVFGNDLKSYCDELITEIPKEKKSINFMFIFYLVLNLVGLVGIVFGAVNFALYQFFSLGTEVLNFSLGSGIFVIIIDFLLLALFVYVIFLWINGSLFKNKKTKKWVEFLQLWLISSLFIGATILVLHFMPAFGKTLSIPHLVIAAAAALIYLTSIILNKKYRFTK
ncbi:DUF1129 family protein [Ralstonia pickettii]|nr:DUF1129 family protein [Ralstonia pickettii]